MKKVIVFLIAIFLNTAFGNPNKHHHGSNVECILEIEDLNFGDYYPLEDSHLRTEALMKVKCSSAHGGAITYKIKLLGGNSPNPKRRFMYSAKTGAKIYYNIFTPHSCVWGDGSNGTCTIDDVIVIQNTSNEKAYLIRGILYGGQKDVHVADDYQDTLTVIIEY
ncbi:fimbrial major subunit CsuA/B family protein [Persephonella atlantica]|uniref:Fimbrial major subunit CsuA/B family protein n=1 Tax=Persephonella atlantica TaxID=2699429 RepID=A0ABS1GH56_9AQUI|nr:spore coat protein U domain-containing protein [Persephonella atlantica]MBK3332082.1 fimbrial major subunit CsuA/B family protein [Persephonella atlantica]